MYEYFRRAKKGLLAGLLLPALVLLGLLVGLKLSEGAPLLQVFALMLIGSLLGMLLGTYILIELFKRMYPPSKERQ